MSYEAKIIADSISEAGHRLTTMQVTFPRIVLSEFNTHRVFSRNSASSRAIPVIKQLMRIEENPFIPVYWGKNQSGMQAAEELAPDEQEIATAIWLQARDDAMRHVRELLEMGVHKQIANRLLEPWMYHTVIVTATEWSNFFALRANPDAQPEIRKIAEMMLEIYTSGKPILVKKGAWHLPLIRPEEYDGVFEFTLEARQISAARCARTSYLTQDGIRDLDADLKLYRRLTAPGHMSPLEHPATPLEYVGKLVEIDETVLGNPIYNWFPTFEGNFRGWKQLRKFIPNEDDFSKARRQ
jgi:thymidylate synthase ThyX